MPLTTLLQRCLALIMGLAAIAATLFSATQIHDDVAMKIILTFLFTALTFICMGIALRSDQEELLVIARQEGYEQGRQDVLSELTVQPTQTQTKRYPMAG